MEQTFHVAAHSATLDILDRGLGLPEYWRRACLAKERLQQMGMPRVNVLFIGADDVVWRALGSSLSLASPVASWRPGDPLRLPEPGRIRTFVVREVGAMSGAEQVRLLSWLDHTVGRVQVVSTSNEPLLPLVEDGRFVNSLYYRLNTVCVDLTD